MILVRHEIGDVLRDVRLQKGRTLRQVASRASVALGYLSEVERGQKEASSEILAAVADALDTPISVIMTEVAGRLTDLDRLHATERVTETVTRAGVEPWRTRELAQLKSIHTLPDTVIPDTVPDELLADYANTGA